MLEKHVEDSLTEQTYLVMHRHINGYGRLFGGQLMMWIDELAGIVAKRHSESEITTACIDQLNFKHPAVLNDTLVMIGRITYVGKTSMEVRVDSYVESLSGMRKMINRAYVVMVAIDEHTGKTKEEAIGLATDELNTTEENLIIKEKDKTSTFGRAISIDGESNYEKYKSAQTAMDIVIVTLHTISTKKTQCDIDNSACPMGNECPFA